MDKELEEFKEKLAEHENRIKKLETLFKNSKIKEKKKKSIKEFIISKKPKNDVQKTLIIGYYLENYEDRSSFGVDDILKGFKEAKEKAPPRKKIYDKIASNIDKGYMMVSDIKEGSNKTWELTSSGEEFVKNGLKN